MKRIVITGASSGLGYNIARTFASKGWTVGIAARRLDRLRELRDQYPSQVHIAEIDITTPEAPDRLLKLIEETGGMDIFLQAAGIGKQNPDLDPDIQRTTLMTNTVGFTAMVDTAYKYFSRHPLPGNTIAAITSVAATRPLGMAGTYSASKRYQTAYLTALEQLSHLQGLDISIVDLRPGFVATDLLNPSNSYPMLMTVDHAVPLLVKAIERRRRVAIIDRRWWWLVKLWRLIPRPLWVRFPAKTNKKQPD